MDVMKDIDSDSVDCIVTDPPYQLSPPNTKNTTKGFMGKSWDICPSVDIWQQCLRVLKPGAFAFVFSIPRQDCLARMICRLEDAGFNVAFSSIYHTFASGFPKAQNLSKAADKRAGVKRDVVGKYQRPDGTSRNYEKWDGKHMGAGGVYVDRDMIKSTEITAPSTDQAKVLDGAYGGFQPKPAVEIIIVAMNPLSERTYLDQAIANGHGCTWLDECRIPHKDSQIEDLQRGRKREDYTFNRVKSKVNYKCPNARFPANILCEDNVLDDGIVRRTHHNINDLSRICHRGKSVYMDNTKVIMREDNIYFDNGSFSRYFSLDAWFAERIKLLPKEAQKTFPWIIVPKASKSEKNRGLEDISNCHATVKPIKLMSWLITLASREDDIVLDPFCGSGTTLIAAKMLGRQYIGIEREEDYCEIARKRISSIPTKLDEY